MSEQPEQSYQSAVPETFESLLGDRLYTRVDEPSQAQTTAPPLLSPEQVESMYAERLQAKLEERRQLFRGIPEEAFVWMAVAPEWTIPLAEACGFPAGEEGVAAAFRRMAENKIVEVCQPLLDDDDAAETAFSAASTTQATSVDSVASAPSTRAPRSPSTHYVMEDVERRKVLSSYTDPEALSRLRELYAHVGRNVLQALESTADVPLSMKRWATLAAAATDGSMMSEVFDAQLEQAFGRGSSAEMLEWIDAARPLAALLARDLDTMMDVTLERASRRIELLRREEYDRRHLKTLLRRDEQLDAFARLMDRRSDDHWALHFVGAGGVGKTMLVRDINVNLAAECGAVAARVDFDYLNADYPSLSPGLLLWSFAQELRVHDKTNRANLLLDKADTLLRNLHRRLEADHNAQHPNPLNDQQFHQALSLYIDAFHALGRRVLLIVDTCEELARIRPDGTVPENVEATFRILTALHNGPESLINEAAVPSGGLPDLRVIFAGRRLLASAGYGWRTDAPELKPRPFLRLHEIRGFTHADAQRFLRDRQVPPELTQPIIRRSPDVGSVVAVEWHQQQEQEAQHTSEEPRCNPYELKLYADWATSDPRPTAAEIEAASDAKYVQLRIIQRLRYPPLEKMLPIIALLGHFDRQTLADISELDESTFDVMFAKLRQQEWIDQRRVAVGDGSETRLVFDVEPGVRKRLLSYFRASGMELTRARRRAADHLERATLEHDLSKLDWSYFDAALSGLEDDAHPERGAEWWERVERRILRERSYAWALNVVGYLRGEDGAAGPRDSKLNLKFDPNALPESRLRASVLATYASALLHEGRHRELINTWNDVKGKASLHPVPRVRAELELRALAGAVAATKYTRENLEIDRARDLLLEILRLNGDVKDGVTSFDEQIAAALVAAVEAIVEHAESKALTITGGSPSELRASTGRSLFDATDESASLRLAQLIEGFLPAWRREMPEREAEQTELFAFACSLAARTLVLTGDYKGAQEWFRRALANAEVERSVSATRRRAVWADWLSPEDIAARLRLEFVRAAYPKFLSPRETLAAIGEWQEPPRTIDSERLHSALLRLHLAEAPLEPEALTAIGWNLSDPATALASLMPEGREVSAVYGSQSCNAYDDVPPLFDTAAKVLTSTGRVEEALSALQFVSANPNKFTVETLRCAERRLVKIKRQWRLRDTGVAGGASLNDSPIIADKALLWALDGLDGPKYQKPFPVPPPESTDQAERRTWLHMIWQTRYALDAASAGKTLRWAEECLKEASPPDNESSDFVSFSLYLDALEAAEIAREHEGSGATFSRDLPRADVALSAWWKAHSNEPKHALMLWLRSTLLAGEFGDKFDPQLKIKECVAPLGKRRAAEIALETGELLALRLPRRAVPVLSQALEWFADCGDQVNRFIAGTALALTCARLGDHKQLDSALREAEKAYRELEHQSTQWATSMEGTGRGESGAEQSPLLPGWDTLDELAAAPTETALAFLAPAPTSTGGNTVCARNWRPWIVRLLACLVYRRHVKEESKREPVAALYAWLKSTYGETIRERTELPAELSVWLEKLAEPEKPSIKSFSGVELLRSSLWSSVLKRGLIVVICLLFGVAVLFSVAVFFAVGFVVYVFSISSLTGPKIDPTPAGTIEAGYTSSSIIISIVALLLALLMGGASATRAWKYFRSRRADDGANADRRHQAQGKLRTWEKLAVAGVTLILLCITSVLLGILPGVNGSPLRIIVGLLYVAGVGLMLIASVIASVAALRNLRSYWLSRTPLVMRISPPENMSYEHSVSTGSSLADLPPVRISLLFSLLMSDLGKRINAPAYYKLLDVTATVPSPTIPYRQFVRAVPEALTAKYMRLRRMLGGRTMEVVVEPDDERHGVCWEAIITLAQAVNGSTNADGPPDSAFRMRRMAKRRARQAAEPTDVLGILGWAESTIATQIMQRGWSSFENDANVTVSRGDGIEDLTSTPKQVHVLHLIGAAERTASGVRLRVAQEQGRRIKGVGGKSVAQGTGERFVRAQEVGQAFPNLSVCIIQLEPGSTGAERLEDDRRDAMLARSFAAAVFTQGIPVVIVIPPLEAMLAVKVVERIAACVRLRPRRGTMQLLAALNEARNLILQDKDLNPETAFESALDVCLYVVADWDGTFG